MTAAKEIWTKQRRIKNAPCGKKIVPKQCKKKDASYEENCGQAQYLWNNYVHLERGSWHGQYLRSNYGQLERGNGQGQYLRNNYGPLERGNWQGQYLRSNYG